MSSLALQDSPARERWREQLSEAIKLFERPEGRIDEALSQAVGYWVKYAVLCEVIESQSATTEDEKRSIRSDLDFTHRRATELIAREAERAGLDSGPLWEEHRICLELFRPFTAFAFGPSPYGLRGFHSKTRISDDWPDCLGEWRYELPAAMQDAIRDGETVLRRFASRYDIANPDPLADQPNPASPPRLNSAVGTFAKNCFAWDDEEPIRDIPDQQWLLLRALFESDNHSKPKDFVSYDELLKAVYEDGVEGVDALRKLAERLNGTVGGRVKRQGKGYRFVSLASADCPQIVRKLS